MKNKSCPTITPAIARVLRGECGYSQEIAPVATLLMNAFNDGKTGLNEVEYPRSVDTERVTWYDTQGKPVEDMAEGEDAILRRLMKLERLAWEMGCIDTGREVTA